jgi:hypothetical protein
VQYVHTIVHAALKDAMRWNRVARNVADAANPPSAACNASLALELCDALEAAMLAPPVVAHVHADPLLVRVLEQSIAAEPLPVEHIVDDRPTPPAGFGFKAKKGKK